MTSAADYEHDGFLLLPSLLDPAECAELKRETEAVPGHINGEEATIRLGLSVVSARFRALHADPRLLAVVAPLMPEGVMFLSDKTIFKSAKKPYASPWHTDRFYWDGTRPKLSVWIALDEARIDNGCLTVVRGSHRREYTPVRNQQMAATNNEFGSIIGNPHWAPEDEVAGVLPVGGALIFGDRTVHGSKANTSGQDRWSAILTYHAPGPDEPFDLRFPARRVLLERPPVPA